MYDSHDYEFCGKDLPERVKTPGPRLVLLFNAGSRPGSGFKARFHFETGEENRKTTRKSIDRSISPLVCSM